MRHCAWWTNDNWSIKASATASLRFPLRISNVLTDMMGLAMLRDRSGSHGLKNKGRPVAAVCESG